MAEQSFDTISEAFSRTAQKYDAFSEDHPHLTRIRNKVYAHVERHIPTGSRILELNAGTGTDAAELARRGYFVHATDIAPGMLELARIKALSPDLNGRLTVQKCSFTELDQVEGGPFDAVFSDLGGLNCIPDLQPVIQQIPLVLKSKGLITWVLMPPICLWEWAEVFRGNLKLAFRRLAKEGTRAHLEGLYFQMHYFKPRQVLDWFKPDYDCLAIEGLSVITPTAESKNFAKRHMRLYQFLAHIDDQLSVHPPWRGWGDFFILTMQWRS